MAVARLGNFEAFSTKHLQTYRLFCLNGENDALIRERSAALQSAFASGGAPPAVVTLDGDSLAREPFGLADELGAMSLFAERRFIRVALGARATHDVFANMLPRLAASDGVMVVVDAGSDKRQDETVQLLAHAALCLVVPCPADDPSELADHALCVLERGDITADRETALALVEMVDADRALLENELTKLLLLCEPRTVLTGAVVRAVVADERSMLLEDGADAVLRGDLTATLDTTDRLSVSSIDATQLVGATIRKALWGHRNATGARAATLRTSIHHLNDAVRNARSTDPLARARAETVLLKLARQARRQVARRATDD